MWRVLDASFSWSYWYSIHDNEDNPTAGKLYQATAQFIPQIFSSKFNNPEVSPRWSKWHRRSPQVVGRSLQWIRLPPSCISSVAENGKCSHYNGTLRKKTSWSTEHAALLTTAKHSFVARGAFCPSFVARAMSWPDDHVRENFPKVCPERVSGSADLTSKAVNPYRLVLKQEILSYVVEEKTFRHSKQPLNAEGALMIESCTKFFSHVILSPTMSKKLFPNNVLLFEWCPF